MVDFEGPKVELGVGLDQLSVDLNNLDNLGTLLPEGTVKDFTSEGNKCSFKVTGGVSIYLELDKNPTGNVILKMNAVSPTPVKFSLEVYAESSDLGCICKLQAQADINPFTRMMVEPAIKGLFEEVSKGIMAKYPCNL